MQSTLCGNSGDHSSPYRRQEGSKICQTLTLYDFPCRKTLLAPKTHLLEKHLTGLPPGSFCPQDFIYLILLLLFKFLTSGHFILFFHPQALTFFALLVNEYPFYFSCLSSMGCPQKVALPSLVVSTIFA